MQKSKTEIWTILLPNTRKICLLMSWIWVRYVKKGCGLGLEVGFENCDIRFNIGLKWNHKRWRRPPVTLTFDLEVIWGHLGVIEVILTVLRPRASSPRVYILLLGLDLYIEAYNSKYNNVHWSCWSVITLCNCLLLNVQKKTVSVQITFEIIIVIISVYWTRWQNAKFRKRWY